jgi:hypothetical protein
MKLPSSAKVFIFVSVFGSEGRQPVGDFRREFEARGRARDIETIDDACSSRYMRPASVMA